MRIIAGRFGRRTLTAPTGLGTRPTADRVREAVFNILQHQTGDRKILADATVLDACCGTGAMALEAISRGARYAYLWDTDTAALEAARHNIVTLGAAAQCQLQRQDAKHPPLAVPPHGQACDLVFLDPPYRHSLPAQIITALQQQGWLAPHAMIVIETRRDEALILPPSFLLKLRRDYGAASLWFFENSGIKAAI